MEGRIKGVITKYVCGHAEIYSETDIYGDVYRKYRNLKSAELCPSFNGTQFSDCSHLGKYGGCCNCEHQHQLADERYKTEQEVA